MTNSLSKTTIADFISNPSFSKSSFGMDGLLIGDSNRDFHLKQIEEEVIHKNINHVFTNGIHSIINNTFAKNTIVFVNINDDFIVSENSSSELFIKIRGHLKLVLYSKGKSEDQLENLFKFLNWMRIVRLV